MIPQWIKRLLKRKEKTSETVLIDFVRQNHILNKKIFELMLFSEDAGNLAYLGEFSEELKNSVLCRRDDLLARLQSLYRKSAQYLHICGLVENLMNRYYDAGYRGLEESEERIRAKKASENLTKELNTFISRLSKKNPDWASLLEIDDSIYQVKNGKVVPAKEEHPDKSVLEKMKDKSKDKGTVRRKKAIRVLSKGLSKRRHG